MRALEKPLLTVATVAGAQRRRAEGLLEALAAQTVAADLEVVVVDTRPATTELRIPPGLAARVLEGGSLSFGEARAVGARAARAEIVAFLEDHCYPERGWAEALISAYRGPWASVGYAFSNMNPRTLRSRMTYLAEYGAWASPRPGPARSLAGNNVSYRTDVLHGAGADLASLLTADHNLHTRLQRTGLPFAAEPAARVRHQNFERLSDAWRGSLNYSRSLAVERARLEGWSRGRRLISSLTVLGAAPLARFAGLARASAREPGRLARVLLYSPAILTLYLFSAFGESLGYLLGDGGASSRFIYWEVDAPRTGEP